MSLAPQLGPISANQSATTSQALQATQLNGAPQSSGVSQILPENNGAAQFKNLLQIASQVSSQKLLAQVIRTIQDSGLAEVRILSSNQLLQLAPSKALKPGQLVVLSQTAQGLKLESQPNLAAQQILKRLLPQQGSINEALNSLAKKLPPSSISSSSPLKTGESKTDGPRVSGTTSPIESRPIESREVSKSEISKQLASLISQLPTRQQVTNPTQLKQVINQTGLMMLAGSKSTPTSQIAQTLAQASGLVASATQPLVQSGGALGQLLLPILKSMLQPNEGKATSSDSGSPSNSASNISSNNGSNNGSSNPNSANLRQAVTEALARTMLTQFRSLGDRDDGELRRTEFLARSDNQIDSFQLEVVPPRITRGQSNDPNPSNEQTAREMDKQWTVKLSFAFPELGKITAFIILSGNKRLEMNVWSNRPATYKRIKSLQKKLQGRLSQRLMDQGIDELNIDVFEGEIPCTKSSITSGLVNEIA